MTHSLVYWPLKAKNIASVVALEVSGLEWGVGARPGSKGTGDLWAEWLEMKPKTPWGFLPNLTVPGGDDIGSELAILQYIGRKKPLLAGESDKDFAISQELIHQGEELYQKITKFVPTVMEKDKSPDAYKNFMTNGDKTTHSAAQGLPVYMGHFE